MKAMIVKGADVIELEDVPEPQTRPDEIKVKIAYCGICGTDVKIIEGKTFGKGFKPEGVIGWPKKSAAVSDDVRIMGYPMRDGLRILGHEASGTIAEIGKDIKGNFKVGQHVAMNFRSVCGGCYYCQNKMEHFCERAMIFMGLMAEYAVFKESLVYPLPEDLPLDVGAFLEPVSVAVHTLDIAHIKIGDTVIITGGGAIGLLALQLAIKSGASKVLVSEPTAERRKLAKQLGADVVVDPLKEDLLAIANTVTDGRGFNVCIEESGIPAIARQLILLAERCGTIVLAATYPQGVEVGVPLEYMYGRELSIRSVLISPYSFPRAVQMLPKLNLKPLITVYPMKEVVKAFEAHKAGKGIKIMLQP